MIRMTTTVPSDENKVLIASLGGVESVLSALRNHSADVHVQYFGLCTLCKLALNGSLLGWWRLNLRVTHNSPGVGLDCTW